MFERQSYIDKIIELLSFLKSKVELSNPVNLTDINVVSENFYRDFLNLLLGYKLHNINIIQQNAAAIDLGDEEIKIAIQVTSTSELKKTRKTVAAYIKAELYKKYDKLVILNIVSRSTHQDNFIGVNGTYQLNTKDDIWDVSELVKLVCDLSLKRLKEVYEFLSNEIKFVSKEILAKEVQTIVSLIGYLSDDSQASAGQGYIEDPDPTGKIYKRFSDYSEFLTKEYQDLYVEYGQILSDVLKQSDIGFTRLRRLGLHLKHESDATLNNLNGNAQLALEKLVEQYKTILSNNGIEYDEGAIRFFLLDQLIKCNVFPNKEEGVHV